MISAAGLEKGDEFGGCKGATKGSQTELKGTVERQTSEDGGCADEAATRELIVFDA